VITANVWERVVQIECGRDVGTGFTFDHNGVQFLVTAKHVVESGASMVVRIRGRDVAISSDELERLTVPVAAADVAVFRLGRPITPNHRLPFVDEIIFGQNCYFLGFPLGVTFDIGEFEYFPLVKRATVSGKNHQINGRYVLLLDGWNNPGFSGGPVVCRPPNTDPTEEPFRVCGIITAYYPQPEGLTVGGQQILGAEVLMNSGIIVAEEIARVIETVGA
jgi:hypothetical protein